jgi:DNA polymerase III epsilon subunit-like protein
VNQRRCVADVTTVCEYQHVGVHSEVPSLLVGFDSETTGLDTNNDEAISYGFAIFRDGTLIARDQFFVLPQAPMHPDAQRIHGISMASLQRRAAKGTALTPLAGASRAIARLASLEASGATFVGSNPMFDLRMLTSTYQRYTHGDIHLSGSDPRQLPFIDVVAHDLALDPDRSTRPRRGLAFLCEHYGVQPGEHDAADDARAAGEVLIAQVRCYQAQLALIVAPRPHRLAHWARNVLRVES